MTARPDASRSEAPLVVLIPVYNDWAAAKLTIERTDRALADARIQAHFLLVDDGSTETIPADPPGGDPASPPNSADFSGSSVDATPAHAALSGRLMILELLRNVGHQRAIAIGLAWLNQHVKPRAVVVMDGDGEDDPADVPRLLEHWSRDGGRRVVFAERRRRSETWRFRMFYEVYCGLHFLLTGIRVRVGNFSVVPGSIVPRLVICDELWNHFAAAVVKTRQPWTSIPTARAARITGGSKMNFVSLVVHGLSAMSVYSETIGVRALTVMLALTAALGAAVMALIGALLLGWPVPTGIGFTFGSVAIALGQAILFGLIFVFVVLKGRQGSAFIPARDYHCFVGRVRTVGARE